MTDELWEAGQGAPTVFYVPRTAGGDDLASFAAAESGTRWAARRRGLRLATRTVRVPELVDVLLDRHPQAGVLVRPVLEGRTLREDLLGGGPELVEGLLALGASLRLCRDGAETSWAARDDWTGGRVVMLVADPFGGGGELPAAERTRRERACARYAVYLGASGVEVVHDRATYGEFVARELDRHPRDPGVTVIVHADAFGEGAAGAEGRPAPRRGSPLWRWLERGVVVHSTGRVRVPAEPGRGVRAKGDEASAGEAGESGPVREETRAGTGYAEGRAMRAERARREALELGAERQRDLEARVERLLEQTALQHDRERAELDRAAAHPPAAASQEVSSEVAEETSRRLRGSPGAGSPDEGPTYYNQAFTGHAEGSAGLVAYRAGEREDLATRSARSIYRDAGNRASVPPARSEPGRDPESPLPRDGLFIRRSTAYGTRAQLGVPELIENGVMVGQDQIRFDDFVAPRAGQVPGPPPGEAVALSHGIAAVPAGSGARAAGTHFVELALKAGAGAAQGASGGEPLPVNLVFVVDVSGSMAGAKLDMVKAALREVHRRLRPADSLGIVTFATEVATLLPGTRKADLPAERFAELVTGMTAGGGTDINLGVQYGIAETGRRASPARTVNRLYLLSDGDPNSGERNWTAIRRNVAARLRGDLTLSCFGFGATARMTELSALAGTAGGSATFVARPGQVAGGLLDDLERRDHLAAIDIQLRIDLGPGVVPWHLYGHDLVTDPRERARVFEDAAVAARTAREVYGTEVLPDLITDEKGIRIFAPDLAYGETYWVVLEVQVPEGWQAGDGLGTATVQYADTLARESRSRGIALGEGAALAEETVVVHAVGLRTSEVTYRALDDLYANDRVAAGRRIDRHIRVLRDVAAAAPAEELSNDRVTLEKFKALAEGLGEAVAYSDSGQPPAGIRAMNAFAQVRSGAVAF
ncbi:VWA domain-containing protein [Streptomyces sp. NPDC101132]|uniref:VWA domain-containing protein n=1 Tax=Streptomyces sp. NPDC101132 TaxID=3366110 RepID=UPI00380512DC